MRQRLISGVALLLTVLVLSAGCIQAEPDVISIPASPQDAHQGPVLPSEDEVPGDRVPDEREVKIYNVGLAILDFEYHRPDGEKETVTVAVWYPTEEEPQPYVYPIVRDYESKVAMNAPVAGEEGSYPLVLFAHGGYGSAYGSSFFTEYLARHGYIVVAPDYVDTMPPYYQQQIAFSRTKEGNVGEPLVVLWLTGQFAEDMSADRDKYLSYLAEHRMAHTSFVIDEMLELNDSPASPFYQTIQEETIGICGHSMGGSTVLGKVGAYPGSKFEDVRIKAALLLSTSAYPFENNIGNIDVPIMLMAGDDDEPAMHPEVPRRTIYDLASPPRFYFVLKNATHFDFGNSVCGEIPLYEAVEINPQASAICRYGLAFFEKYLRGNLSADEQLGTTDSALVYYIKEEVAGESCVWGSEPPPGTGGAGGIRRELWERENR